MMILKSTLLSPEIYTYEKCRAMGKMKLSPGHTVKALRFSINAKQPIQNCIKCYDLLKSNAPCRDINCSPKINLGVCKK